jgi:hypothetical protein
MNTPLSMLLSILLLIQHENTLTALKDELYQTEHSEQKVSDSEKFPPDISVNGIFLQDNASVETHVGDLIPRLIMENDSLTYYLLNTEASQFFKLAFHPGSMRNAFSIFEVGSLTRTIDKQHSTTLKTKEFVTENGVKLGISKQDIIEKKGTSFEKLKGNSIRYVLDDFENSPFLKRYNTPVYFAVYEFDRNNLLIKYTFGFEYP